MGEHLIKPYEISVWEDKLIQYGENDYRLEENKLAVIGSDTMTGLNKVYDPVFNKKSNGEKSLVFSLKYKYFDPYSGKQVENPFVTYLVNERKVKLKYDNQWYEFIIKDHSESSEDYTWTYTCSDAFVLELSKQGYNITFDSELNNNQGTAEELVIETLKDTDWQLKGVNIGKQLIEEPIYKATLNSTNNITIINASNDGASIPSAPTQIYIFYSYIKNQDGKFVQFIIRDDNKKYVIDDRNVITDTNFRILTELTYDEASYSFKQGTNSIITLDRTNNQDPVENRYHANRLAYGKLNTYDKVMGRTVERLGTSDGDREIYKYTDYEYTTSDVVMNYFTNGDNFNVLENGTLQGWSPYTDNTSEVKELELVTRPELKSGQPLANINSLAQIEGFLKVYFNGARTEQTRDGQYYIYNTIYNSGIENSSSFIQSISKGQEFVFRWRAGKRNPSEADDTKSDLNCLVPASSLRILVAKYSEEVNSEGYYYKHINPADIILDFIGQVDDNNILNNEITGGIFETVVQNNVQKLNYVIDGVVQTPSTKYIYIDNENHRYVWNNENGDFEQLNNNWSNYLPYYYLTATAQRSISNSELTDIKSKFGIFIYTVENIGEAPIYIQDIQLTRFLLDGSEEERKPVTIGNVPTASSISTDYYYLRPDKNVLAEDVETYTDLRQLESDLGIAEGSIKPLYNENSEKFLTISASQSNCFNILQTIAETFECWVDLVVEHDPETGYITYTDGKPDKFIYLREYIGKDNFAGFKYGINLDSIERTVNSDEIVTKLIVDQTQSDVVEEGYVSIANAPSNLSSESYILNFDYYYNQGLLNREETELDKLGFVGQVAIINKYLKQVEQLRRSYEMSMLHLDSKRTDYTLLIESAQTAKNEALAEFTKLTGMTYEEYKVKHQRLIDEDSETETITIVNDDDFSLQYLPADEKAININVNALGLSAHFVGGEPNANIIDSALTEVEIGQDISAENQEDIVITAIPETYVSEVSIQGYNLNEDEYKEYTWDIASLVDTEVWTGVEEIAPIYFTISAERAARTEGVLPDTVQFYELNGKFLKGVSSHQILDDYLELIYDPSDDSIYFKIYNFGDAAEHYYISALSCQLTIEYSDGLYIPEETDVYISGTTLNSEDWMVQIVTGVDSSGSNDILSYTYNASTGIINITAIQDIRVVSYKYKSGIILSYDGIKTFSLSQSLSNTPLTAEVQYFLSSDNQLTNEETVLETLGELYVSSSTINNYSGLLTNVEQEYWKIRKALRGSENYSIKVWRAKDYVDNYHVYVEASDYIQGATFTLSGNTYQFGLSKKYFDIQSNATTISFNISGMNGYYFDGSGESTTTREFNVGDFVTKIKLVTNDTINGAEDLIKEYQEEKDEITRQFNNKYSRYIQEGTWSSTEYIDPELYYLDALQVSNTSAQPVVSYTINVVEISELEGFGGYSFDAGDKSYIEDPEFFGWQDIDGVRTPAREEVIVSEVEWHLDDPSQNIITVQNYKTRFEDLFQRISAAVQTVQYNEATYAKTTTLLDTTNSINQNLLLDSLNSISGKNYSLTGNSSVVVDGDQILIQNLNNLANRVIINSEGIQVSSDGGMTWKTVINGLGLNLSGAYAGNINTDDIIIGGNSNSNLRWDNSGISAYKVNKNGVYDLNNYVRYDEYGLYGIKDDVFKAQSLQDVLNKAYFAVTWDGFFIRNSYSDGGRVSITSDNDFQVIDGSNVERIKIGSLGVNKYGEHVYGINISDKNGRTVLNTNNNGDLTMTGTINALGGNFTGVVNVGSNDPYIKIDGINARIGTSNYQSGAGYGWMISADGDAVFNNITARGAIKTAVFEYAEIQAVGGIFVFRPSSTIKTATLRGNDIVVTVEKPMIFKQGQWCKVSNYATGDNDPDVVDVNTGGFLQNNGLTNVYPISNKSDSTPYEITLQGAGAMIDNGAIVSTAELVGGALIDMGNKANGDGRIGTANYGIGVNSSDNTVNLPARAISLFETIIDERQSLKVSYDYRGILGTLPTLPENKVRQTIYPNYMEGTQGIYTDNMYIGDGNQYIAFYTDNNGTKHLRISVPELIMAYDPNPETGELEEVTLDDKLNEIETTPGPAGEPAITVRIESNVGNEFVYKNEQAVLTCTVIQGNSTNITDQVSSFTWTKRNRLGEIDNNWTRTTAENYIIIDTSDVDFKAIFGCEVEF